MVSDMVGLLVSKGMGVVQMDCTEFSLYGKPRSPRSKEDYDTPRFKQRCREIAKKKCGHMRNFLEKGGIERLRDIDAHGGHKLGFMFEEFAAHARSCYY
jgi:predicted secreted protein